MVRMRTKRQPYPSAIAYILAGGHDFFNDLPGGIEKHLPMLKRAWRDPEIRAATIAHHNEVGHLCGEGKLWAREKFGE